MARCSAERQLRVAAGRASVANHVARQQSTRDGATPAQMRAFALRGRACWEMARQAVVPDEQLLTNALADFKRVSRFWRDDAQPVRSLMFV